MRPHVRFLAMVGIGVLAAPLATAGTRPTAVSPGGATRLVPAAACPTFSWVAAGSGALEVEVYRLADDGSPAGPAVVREQVPAGASSWTLAADRCLPPGRYAWAVRAPGAEATQWSEPRLFLVAETAAGLDTAMERAVERVLERWLAEGRLGAARTAALAPELEEQVRTAAAPPDAPPSDGGGQPSFVADNAEYDFPDCTEEPPLFSDVPNSDSRCPFIKQFAADEISTGCAGGRFCPDDPVTRGQLAVYLEKAMRGSAVWDVNADLLDGLDSTAFLRTAGGAMTGNIDMQGRLITNIGSNGTDFTSGGGLILAAPLHSQNFTYLGDDAADEVYVHAGEVRLLNATSSSDALFFGNDVNLYRSGTNQLRTDDGLSVGASLQVGGGTTLGDAIFDRLTIPGSIVAATPLRIIGPGESISFLAFSDTSTDRTATFPDASGEVSLLGQTIEAAEITNLTRMVNLQLPAFLNCSDDEEFDFSSGSDNDPDFSTGTLFLEWDVDATADTDSACTTLLVPPDFVANGSIRIVSRAGASHDNDWSATCTKQTPGTPTPCTGHIDFACDLLVDTDEVYTCSIALDGLAAGDGVMVRIARAGGSDPMRAYAVGFAYTASQ